MTSRLLKAEAHSRSSACAQVTKNKTKRRKVSAPITKPTQLNDRASTRTRANLRNNFVKTASRLAPAPTVSSSAFPQEEMMLVMRRENATRTESTSLIQITTNNPDRLVGLVGNLMDNQQLNAAFGVWAQQNGWIQQSTGAPTGNNMPPLPGLGDSAPAAASASDDSSASSSSDPAASPDALPNNMSLFISDEELEALAGL